MLAMRRGIGLLSCLVAVFCVLGMADSPPTENIAIVPAPLQKDRAYTEYAAMMVQIDLLSNAHTASLPINVAAVEPGLIMMTGTVPNERIHKAVVKDARRVSGLLIRDTMRVHESPVNYGVTVSEEQLKELTKETVETLFPDLKDLIQAQVAEDGVVVLLGSIPSVEAKLMLCQAIKSQPGCQAVACLLNVDPEPQSGLMRISEDGKLKLLASQIPAAPAPESNEPKASSVASNRPSSGFVSGAADDDVPSGNRVDQQIREDVEALVGREINLDRTRLEVDVNLGVVTLTGELKNREQVEQAVDAASQANGVTKVVAKCKPYSMQRYLANGANKDKKKDVSQETPKGMFSFLSWPFQKSDDKLEEGVSNDRRFRSNVHRTIKKRCGKRLSGLAVRQTPSGLLIEGEVGSPRERTFVMGQIDNVIELRAIRYDVMLHIKD